MDGSDRLAVGSSSHPPRLVLVWGLPGLTAVYIIIYVVDGRGDFAEFRSGGGRGGAIGAGAGPATLALLGVALVDERGNMC